MRRPARPVIGAHIAPEIAVLASPIEWIFEQALRWALGDLKVWQTLFIPAGEVLSFGEFPPPSPNRIVVAPQIEVGQYRVDFGVIVRPKGWHACRFAFECDGHAFHERTPEQAAHDRARDRTLLGRHVYTVRYTAADILADAQRCAAEALQVAIRASSPDVREGI